MGSLTDIEIPTVDVPLPGKKEQTLTVRGLSVPDLCGIYRQHSEVLEGLYEKFKSDGAVELTDVAQAVIGSGPELAALIIATANDAPEQTAVAARLPSMVQIRATVDVLKLTCNSVAEVKKMLADVLAALEASNEVLSSMNSVVKTDSPSTPTP